MTKEKTTRWLAVVVILLSLFLACSQSAPSLSQRLADQNYAVRVAAVWEISKDSQLVTKYLATLFQLALSDPSWEVRVGAIWALRKAQDQSISILIKALQDKSPKVRVQAAIVLSQMGKKSRAAIPALRQAAKDGDNEVRRAAKSALLEIESNK